MRRSREISLTVALAVGVITILATCANYRMPVIDGAVIEIRRSDGRLVAGDKGYKDTLQLYWFGTGCHLIQLGDATILTDPFVSNQLKLEGFRSDPDRVDETIGKIPPPDAVLINHSHFDHILDAYAVMQRPDWRKACVPLFGGESSKNLLAGWKDPDVNRRCHAIKEKGGVIFKKTTKCGYEIEITAYPAIHPPHLKCGFTLADGRIKKPRTSAPTNFFHYQAGEVFNYLIKLSGHGAEYTVLYLGAPCDMGEYPDSMPKCEVDVLISLAPTSENVTGYPETHLSTLKPKHIVLSHFNTFAKNDPDEELNILGIDFAKTKESSREIQKFITQNAGTYSRFEKFHIPAITQWESSSNVRNVIHIAP